MTDDLTEPYRKDFYAIVERYGKELSAENQTIILGNFNRIISTVLEADSTDHHAPINYIHARFPPHGEGMWVKVDGAQGNGPGQPETATGILDNKPIDSPDYRYGQRVNLKKDDEEGWIPA